MACGRTLMNYQDGESIGKALSVFSAHIKQAFPRYDMATAHKEILLDFAEGEVNAFQESFGVEINNVIHGCSKVRYENSKDHEFLHAFLKLPNLHVSC